MTGISVQRTLTRSGLTTGTFGGRLLGREAVRRTLRTNSEVTSEEVTFTRDTSTAMSSPPPIELDLLDVDPFAGSASSPSSETSLGGWLLLLRPSL